MNSRFVSRSFCRCLASYTTTTFCSLSEFLIEFPEHNVFAGTRDLRRLFRLLLSLPLLGCSIAVITEPVIRKTGLPESCPPSSSSSHFPVSVFSLPSFHPAALGHHQPLILFSAYSSSPSFFLFPPLSTPLFLIFFCCSYLYRYSDGRSAGTGVANTCFVHGTTGKSHIIEIWG